MPHSIGIEASSILKTRTGIGHYNYQVLLNLLEIDRISNFKIFTNSLKDTPDYNLFSSSDNFSIYHTRVPGKVLLELWKQFRKPKIEKFIGQIDLFHSTNNNPVPSEKGIRVITIYDLYFMRKPENADRYGGRYFHKVLPRYIHEWDHILTISEAMKKEIIEFLDIPASKISIAPCAVDPYYLDFETTPTVDIIPGGLPKKFILAVGTLEPRKNYPVLLKAFRQFLDRNNMDYYLVISGIDGCGSRDVHETVDKLNLHGNVLLLGYLTREQLRFCYRNARLFVMVSEYEGFGIPVLEAMACGIPVLASNITSFPEVIKDAGVLVNPAEPDSIAEEMDRILKNPELSDTLVTKGYLNLDRFSWKKTAENIHETYKKLLDI